MEDDIYVRIAKMVSEHCAEPIERLYTDVCLQFDLGMDGDDAYDFFLAYKEEFQIDMSDFQFNLHFGDEGMPFPALPLILFMKRRFISPRIPITIGDLVECARAKKWITPKRKPVSP